MSPSHDLRFPGESDAYRAARERLLRAEAELRRRVEEVAALRRGLPPGGPLKEDYSFEEGPPDLARDEPVRTTRFSELFEGGKDTLLVYSFMYPPDGDACPMCTAFLDGFNGNAQHLAERIDIAVVAKAPLARIRRWARARGWHNLRLLSSGHNSFNADYHAETADGLQRPLVNVFQKSARGIHHRYCSELFFAPSEDGQHPRHIDLLWPLWNALDLTPEGRGSDWYPMASYERTRAEVGQA